jgi:hypothetical protein
VTAVPGSGGGKVLDMLVNGSWRHSHEGLMARLSDDVLAQARVRVAGSRIHDRRIGRSRDRRRRADHQIRHAHQREGTEQTAERSSKPSKTELSLLLTDRRHGVPSIVATKHADPTPWSGRVLPTRVVVP